MSWAAPGPAVSAPSTGDPEADLIAPSTGDPGTDASDVAARPGQLTPGWQVAVTIGWIGTIVALAAVWNTSRQLGLSTWWLGPPAQPRPLWVSLAPFVPPATVAVLAVTGRRHVPWAGLVAAACVAAVGAGDLGRVVGLGIVELVVAVATALVSIAAFAGTYRSVETDAGAPA